MEETKGKEKEDDNATEINLGWLESVLTKGTKDQKDEWLNCLKVGMAETVGDLRKLDDANWGLLGIPPVICQELKDRVRPITTTPSPEFASRESVEGLQVQLRELKLKGPNVSQSNAQTYERAAGESKWLDKPVETEDAKLKEWVEKWEGMMKIVQQKEKEKKRHERREDVIQDRFPDLMNDLFKNLEFYGTHRDSFIAYPQKPDVTVTPRNLHLHTQSTLALVELHHSENPIDGSMKGQLISAVTLVSDALVDKRDVWGFAINGTNDSFVYRRCVDATSQVGEKVPLKDMLGHWAKINADAPGNNTLPSIVNACGKTDVKCRLGRGKTADVFEVEVEHGALVLKVPREGYKGILEREFKFMEKMREKGVPSRHFASLPPGLSFVSVQWKGNPTPKSIEGGFFSSPCGTPFRDLVREDVVELAAALLCFHEKGFIHADISPSNISFDCEHVPFFHDFGFSVVSSNTISPYQGAIGTASNAVLTSLSQGQNSIKLTPRDDVESLVKTIFMILSGREPRVCSGQSVQKKAEEALLFWNSTGFVEPAVIDEIVVSPNYCLIERLCWLLPSREETDSSGQKKGSYPSPEATKLPSADVDSLEVVSSGVSSSPPRSSSNDNFQYHQSPNRYPKRNIKKVDYKEQ